MNIGECDRLVAGAHYARHIVATDVRWAMVDTAWLRYDLNRSTLKVLVALSSFADRRKRADSGNFAYAGRKSGTHGAGLGRCFASKNTIAKTAMVSPRTVASSLRELESEALITTIHRAYNASNIYYVSGMGRTDRMPPSEPKDFFTFVRACGYHFYEAPGGNIEFDRPEPGDDLLDAIILDYLLFPKVWVRDIVLRAEHDSHEMNTRGDDYIIVR